MNHEEVVRLAEEGKSYREISEITGYSYAQIHRILKQEVEKRKRLLQERGESKVENVKSVVSELNKYVNEVDEKEAPEIQTEPEEEEKSVLRRPLKGNNLIFVLLIAAAVVIAIAYFMRPKEKIVEKVVYLPPPDEERKRPPRTDYVVI